MKSPNDERLSPAALKEQLDYRLPGWQLAGDCITRTWHTENWKGTMMLAGAIAHLAEVAWHHPELRLNYGSVEVRLSTHTAAGVTDKDLALAEKITALLSWQPESPLEHTPDTPESRYLKG